MATPTRIAVVTPTMKSGEQGGAEALYTGLVRALRAGGFDADQIEVGIDESTFESIMDSYARCAALDLDDYDMVISTKAPTYMVRHRRHVSYFVHTIRVFYDMFAREFGEGTQELRRQRAAIHQLDREALDPARVCRRFAIGRTPVDRLYDADPSWHQVPFETLHPPTVHDAFASPRDGDYVLLPGRLHRWKRADLVLRAFRQVKADLCLKVVGTGEDEAALRTLAAGDPRIEFLGRVSDSALVDLYAGALVVPFVPQQEDYGLITIEAFRSSKPVITCTDSGEPLEFVRDGRTGSVVAPDPAAIAGAIDWMAANRAAAAEMGRNGRAAVSHITWERVVSRLVGSASASSGRTRRVAVLDMQPIDPPVGGGRLRLLGLYHGLGADLPTTYVGSYDWPGERRRRVRHSDTLDEITVPLSGEHFQAAADWQERTGGKTVIDVSFALLAGTSPEYVVEARAAAADADIVVFSHPWVYPLVKDQLDRRRQLLVYDAQNVEGVLRASLLGDSAAASTLARHVADTERELCRDADVVLACSHDDRVRFHDLYDVPIEKIVVVPNGTFVRRLVPATPTERAAAKAALTLPAAPMAIFLGSAYGPNVEAARYLRDDIALRLPHVTFVIGGGVSDALGSETALPPNVRATGALTDEEKSRYLTAADLAINPMFSGSGTNVKMFDFMAAGLPVVTTPIGARGIAQGVESAFRIAPPEELAAAVESVLTEPAHAADLARTGRRLVEEKYSWERISARLGTLLMRYRARLDAKPPRFSVVVATYDRHDRLPRLLESLAAQTCRDFEVIIIDQSPRTWNGAAAASSLDVLYVHTDVRGATKARNTGASLARGRVLAFTDDDCVPQPDWLRNAERYFEDPAVVGVEGMITSDKLNDPEYRTVSNVGFEGIGFMTANLLLRRDTFVTIDGFDERFDNPHFREDTDLARRALEHGTIPYGRDVRVYHPPHRRDLAREGHAERSAFFEKDALLLQKHPRRYRTLMAREGHFRNTREFPGHVLRGAAKYGVSLDPRVRWLLKSRELRTLVVPVPEERDGRIATHNQRED